MSWFYSPTPTEPEKEEVVETSKDLPSLAFRRRANLGGAFSSTKCPPGPGLENSCEAPFGFVWTPMADLGEDGKGEKEGWKVIDCDTALPPVICITCLAYINPYCKANYQTGVWTCALCDTDNVLPPQTIQDGQYLEPVLQAPLIEYQQALPVPPAFSKEDSSTIVLVVDANLEPSDAKGIVSAIQQVLPSLVPQEGELFPKIQLGLVAFHQTVLTYQLGVAGVASADVYLPMDGTEDDETLLHRRAAMENREYLLPIHSAQDLDSFQQCLSAVFGSDLTSVSTSTPNTSRAQELRRKKEARERQEQLKSAKTPTKQPPAESPFLQAKKDEQTKGVQRRSTGDALQCAIDLCSMDHASRTSRILVFTNGCPNNGDASVVAAETPNDADQSDKSPRKRNKRHDVIDATQLAKSVEYCDLTASLAMESGIAIDVLCCGSNVLGMPAYQALVQPSGGYVLSHASLDTPHLAHNLTYLLRHTYVSRRSPSSTGDDKEDEAPKKNLLQRFLQRHKPKDTLESSAMKTQPECVIDIRTDSYVVPTHLVGPGEVINSIDEGERIPKSEKAAFADGSRLAASNGFPTNNLPSNEALELSMTRIRLSRADPLASVAVMVQANETMADEDEYAFFQLICRFVDPSGTVMITRVATHRLHVAKSVSDYVQSMDDEVVSVILAKCAVYRSLHGRDETEDTKDKIVSGDTNTLERLSFEAQLDLDATVQRISGSYRLLGLEEKTASIDLEGGGDEKIRPASSLEIAFPPQLTETLRRLYHLRRGALISPGPMNSVDDRAGMRQLFLRFSLEDCIGMMAPDLWSTGNLVGAKNIPGAMQPFPAETLALWDSSIIAADQHDLQFIWSGKNCVDPNQFDGVRKKFRKFLEEKAKNRFPMPEVFLMYGADSMSRRFTTRLAPSHADTEDQQLVNFPELSQLSGKELQQLRTKFEFYDASSDASFRKWFWSVSSATHASREDGASLCE